MFSNRNFLVVVMLLSMSPLAQLYAMENQADLIQFSAGAILTLGSAVGAYAASESKLITAIPTVVSLYVGGKTSTRGVQQLNNLDFNDQMIIGGLMGVQEPVNPTRPIWEIIRAILREGDPQLTRAEAIFCQNAGIGMLTGALLSIPVIKFLM